MLDWNNAGVRSTRHQRLVGGVTVNIEFMPAAGACEVYARARLSVLTTREDKM